jgi:hypothetical protein
VAAAWLCATLFSGLPSTMWALLTGGDALEATRAAARMLAPAHTSMAGLFVAAGLVHASVSLFWSLILAWVLPERHIVAWSLLASAAIALLDLEIIAPAMFPEVAALSFWPQFADHLMWGACFGQALAWRSTRRSGPGRHRGG